MNYGLVTAYNIETGIGHIRPVVCRAGRGSISSFTIDQVRADDRSTADGMALGEWQGRGFWYTTESDKPSARVKHLWLTPYTMPPGMRCRAARYVEFWWRQPSTSIPAWLPQITVQLLGASKLSMLQAERGGPPLRWRTHRQSASRCRLVPALVMQGRDLPHLQAVGFQQVLHQRSAGPVFFPNYRIPSKLSVNAKHALPDLRSVTEWLAHTPICPSVTVRAKPVLFAPRRDHNSWRRSHRW